MNRTADSRSLQRKPIRSPNKTRSLRRDFTWLKLTGFHFPVKHLESWGFRVDRILHVFHIR